MFDRQRSAIELTHRAFSQGSAVQRRAMRSFVDSIEAQRALSEQATAFVDSAMETAVILTTANLPGDEAAMDAAEARFEEQRNAFGAFHDASWSLLSRSMRDNLAAYERYAEVYDDAVDAAFDTAAEGTDWMSERASGRLRNPERATEVEIDVE